ncbi:MAG: hypothetical protein ABI220_05070 [Candidatus Saccharimonadales bacterium]
MDYQGYPEQSYVSRLIRYILGLLILVIVVVFLVWLFFFRGNSNDNKVATNNKPIGSNSINQKEEQTKSPSEGVVKTPDNDSSATTNSSSSGQTATTGQSTTTSSTVALPNTGPGNVVALFAVAALAGMAGKYAQLRRSLGRR